MLRADSPILIIYNNYKLFNFPEMKNEDTEHIMHDSHIKKEITFRWDNYADNYDSFISHGILTEEERKLWVTAFLHVLPPNTENLNILDVGCGTGAIGFIFAEMGHTVTCLDLSERMMDIGRQKAADRGINVRFVSGDAENPPFSDNEFDIVISRHLLWTLPHPADSLLSWKRIVKPGGKVLAIAGVWDDGTKKSQVIKSISGCLGKIIDSSKSESLTYSSELQRQLPHIGGISEENARSYFVSAGFNEIRIYNLIHIRENQKKRLPWYQRMNPLGTYYLISGTKS